MKIIGIDPGVSGAIAILDTDALTLTVVDTPTETVVRNKKNRTDIDVKTLAGIVQTIHASKAFVEKVGPKPTDGTVGAFTFGKSYGCVLAALAVVEATVTDVSPQAWKKKANLIGEDKDVSRERATETFPLCSGIWKFKKNHGRAEAALIAAHGVRELGLAIDLTKVSPQTIKL